VIKCDKWLAMFPKVRHFKWCFW